MQGRPYSRSFLPRVWRKITNVFRRRGRNPWTFSTHWAVPPLLSPLSSGAALLLLLGLVGCKTSYVTIHVHHNPGATSFDGAWWDLGAQGSDVRGAASAAVGAGASSGDSTATGDTSSDGGRPVEGRGIGDPLPDGSPPGGSTHSGMPTSSPGEGEDR